jgi:hypothetical protein
MERAVASLREIAELNTDLVRNCLEGVTADDALRRPIPRGNNLAFIVAHLVDARHFLAKLLGRPLENPLTATLGDVSTIEEVKDLPSLDELRAMWGAISGHLEECLLSAPPETLAAEVDQLFPIADGSVLGAVTFLLQHESYHVGQLGLIRKSLGYEAMSYERAPRAKRDTM